MNTTCAGREAACAVARPRQRQLLAAYTLLDKHLSQADSEALTQASLTVAVAWSFSQFTVASVVKADASPMCNATPNAWSSTRPSSATPSSDRSYTQPPSTMKFCAEHIADACEARNSAMLAMCSGNTLPGRHWLRLISSLAASSTHIVNCFRSSPNPAPAY